MEAMAPWTPVVVLSLLYTAWVYLSPSDILYREPRLMLFSLGMAFSNVTVSSVH